MRPELHKSHVATLRQLGDALNGRKESKNTELRVRHGDGVLQVNKEKRRNYFRCNAFRWIANGGLT
jgi:hypothetical protein